MLFVFELLLAIIIVAVRHYLKNKEKYQIKLKRMALKIVASILAILLTVTILLQEIFQQLLDRISGQKRKKPARILRSAGYAHRSAMS